MNVDFTQLDASATTTPYLVTRDATVAYARATNDSCNRHLSGEIAPPLFAVVPALKIMAALKRRVYGGFALHAEHEICFNRPIVPGVRLTVDARVAGIVPSPAGAVIVVQSQTRDEGGDLFNEQYLVTLTQGLKIESIVGKPAPAHRMPEGLTANPPLATKCYDIDPDQTLRYADASGDRDAYTFDDAVARDKGLPGAIVHGLCTMAFTGRAVVEECCAGDSRRLSRLAVRFSRLLLLREGKSLTTRIWKASAGPLACFAFEANDGKGAVVIRHGWAEVRE